METMVMPCPCGENMVVDARSPGGGVLEWAIRGDCANHGHDPKDLDLEVRDALDERYESARVAAAERKGGY